MNKAEPLKTPFSRDRSKDAQVPTTNPGLFVGVVVGNLMPNNLVQVRLQGLEREINCVWAAGVISGLLGFKTSYVPPIKTKVLVYFTNQELSFIVGSLPTTMMDPLGQQRAILDPEGAAFGDAEVYKARRKGGVQMMASHKPPLDLAEGEIVLDNLMGVGIALLRNLASLSAGDMARVETHLMDDMVRVISGTFRHHSAIGDHKIYNDGGRLNMEFNGTLYDFEAYGSLNNSQPRAKMDTPDKPNLGQDSQIDGFTDDGRWRLSQYVGWLGDFINLWVTDPVQALGRLAADQLRAGKFRFHANSDGSCIVQSVSEICLEKVVRIPVPIRKRREDDPEGNRSDSAGRSTKPLANWKPSGNLFEMAFQLREYSRWLNNTWTMGRFHQMDLDFKVPTEAETPAPNPDSYQEDRAATNGGVASWTEAYACIRILRDGSTMIVDGYGNSILTTSTGVQISSTKDIYLEAAGSVNIVAGRDINLVAQKNLNLTAVKETVRIKSEQMIQMLAKAGKIIMDFVTPGWLVVKNGNINVNGGITLDGAVGKIDASGQITAMLVAQSIHKMVQCGNSYQSNHVHDGAPAPTPLGSDEFQYQSDYAAGDLYQTFTQSILDKGEKPSTASWSFAGNAVPGKGSPWPGANPNFKKATGGTNLNQPSSTVQPTNEPVAMTTAPITLKTQ